MQLNDFKKEAHQLVEWIADYFQNLESYPVKSQSKPGEIYQQLPSLPPKEPLPFEEVFKGFKETIMPGITHWQHPSFFAYFPANNSFPSILAEMLMAALGVQCMSWQTSPAATELEERVCEWVQALLDLPKTWHGSIQTTASECTLTSLITAISKRSDYQNIEMGLSVCTKYTVYCSKEAHSSIQKAVKLSGLGLAQLRVIDTNNVFAIDIQQLETQIKHDLEQGFTPLWITACIGTTGTTAIDPVADIQALCHQYNLWLHIDAAYAGSAFLCPELRQDFDAIEKADSFVFNPHKWLLTNFDCSVYYVKDKDALLNTFAMNPPYLQTNEDDEVNNYRDWGIPLGRRFRSLKLWFVISCYGVTGLRDMIRKHCALAKSLSEDIKKSNDFELLAPIPFNLICFRYHPSKINDELVLNDLNKKLMDMLNESGELYLTHTENNGQLILRLCIGSSYVEETHVNSAWTLILNTSKMLL